MRGADHHAVDALQLAHPSPSARRWRPKLFSESRMPVVTSSLVGAFTAPATLPSSIRTASVLVPPTSIADASHVLKHAPELEVIAEGARADMRQGRAARGRPPAAAARSR